MTTRIPKLPSLHQKWMDIIEMENGSKFNGLGRVCNLHFNENDFLIKCRVIKAEAVPNIFPRMKKNNIEIIMINLNALKEENIRLKESNISFQTDLFSERKKFDVKLKEYIKSNEEKSAEISRLKMQLFSLEKKLKESQKHEKNFKNLSVIVL